MFTKIFKKFKFHSSNSRMLILKTSKHTSKHPFRISNCNCFQEMQYLYIIYIILID